jgi:hypothetical protein
MKNALNSEAISRKDKKGRKSTRLPINTLIHSKGSMEVLLLIKAPLKIIRQRRFLRK